MEEMGAAAAPGSTPALPPRTSAYSEGAKRAMPSTGEPVHVVVWTNCPAFNGLAHEKIWLVPDTVIPLMKLSEAHCYSPSLQSGCIAMRLLSLARHKWPSKADGRETLVDAAGAPPGFPLVPTP